jgi:hypothetical protein
MPAAVAAAAATIMADHLAGVVVEVAVAMAAVLEVAIMMQAVKTVQPIQVEAAEAAQLFLTTMLHSLFLAQVDLVLS